MAPVIDPPVTVVEILPWPIFTAIEDGQPAMGAKLYSYVPGTSTPKATTADPLGLVPNPQPTLMNDQGQAVIYLPHGLYDLRLYNADDVLLWQVFSYAYSTGITPTEGAVTQQGTTQQTVTATPGASVLTASAMVPQGYRVLGVTTAVLTAFSTTQGLTSFAVGDGVALERWGLQTTLTAGATTGQIQFRAGDEPMASPAAYAVLLSALGGLFDTGSAEITAYWEALLPPA